MHKKWFNFLKIFSTLIVEFICKKINLQKLENIQECFFEEKTFSSF